MIIKTKHKSIPNFHFGEWSIYFGSYRHYEIPKGFPLNERARVKCRLSIKNGKKKKLVNGFLVLETIHHSRESLADYLYDYRFYPSTRQQVAKLFGLPNFKQHPNYKDWVYSCQLLKGIFMRKTLYLIRGLPGSGKSTLAEAIQPDPLFRCAVDDYFTDKDGNYNFQAEKLWLAHKKCQTCVQNAMFEGKETIVVHNTMCERWEADIYYQLAKEYGYSVFVLECQNNFGNIHNVPDEAVQRMANRWQTREEWNQWESKAPTK